MAMSAPEACNWMGNAVFMWDCHDSSGSCPVNSQPG